MLAPDTTLAGKYVIRGPLESGGMGDVYDAWQKDLGRPVAIKLLQPDLIADASMLTRFRREAEAAASLGHPNIVQILDFRNEPPEPPILVMEKLEGRSLRVLLEKEKTITPARAAFIGLQILSALAAAHDAGIVHRDMKPANVFILSTFAVRDFVKVLDFGVAKLLEPGAGSPLTDLGQVIGTASYMAPEQAKGMAVDGRADLFAVGGILFEAITGQRPRELGPAGIIDAGTMPCRKLNELAPNVDPKLAAVIDRSLSLDREARFSSAKAMASALAPFAPQELIDVGRTGREASAIETVAARSSLENAATAMTPAPPPASPLAPTELSAIPPTRYGAPLPPARVSAPAPAPPRMSYPAPSRPTPKGWPLWFYAVPVVVVGMVVVVIVTLALIGFHSRDEERDLLASKTPSRCAAPSTCTGRTVAVGDTYATCAPLSANHYRAGDVVFVLTSSSPHPATFVSMGSDGTARVKSAGGTTRDVDVSALRGVYCLP